MLEKLKTQNILTNSLLNEKKMLECLVDHSVYCYILLWLKVIDLFGCSAKL